MHLIVFAVHEAVFQGENQYNNANADVCVFVAVDEKLGMGTEEGGLVTDLAGALRQPALHSDRSMQSSLTELMQTHSDSNCSFKPQMISTLPNLICYPLQRMPPTRAGNNPRICLTIGKYNGLSPYLILNVMQ